MKLTVLVENIAGGRLGAEHGLSYYIEYDNKTILFDTGHSDLFLRNATLLNIDLKKNVDTIVLSHGHWDHGNGLKHIVGKQLITHPSSFQQRYRKTDKTNIGIDLSINEVKNKFNLITSKVPVNITDKIIYLGEVPRITDFESKTTPFVLNNNIDDFIIDDSALVFIVNKKLVIVSGCAHSGICNIISYAKKVTGINQVDSVIGGFHLKYNNQQTQSTIQYLKQLNVTNIIPSHCTEFSAMVAFHEVFQCQLLKTGMVKEFE